MLRSRLITTLLCTSFFAGCAGTHGTRYVGHEVAQAPQHQRVQDPYVLTEQYFPPSQAPAMVRPVPAPPAAPMNSEGIPPAPSMEEQIPAPPMTTMSHQKKSDGLEPVSQTPVLLRPISSKQYSRLGGHSFRNLR